MGAWTHLNRKADGGATAMTIRKLIYDGDGLQAWLSYYSAGERMRAHAHAYHQASWLMCGDIRERHGDHEKTLCGQARGSKPAGLSHANDYGPHGALILAINVAGQMDAGISSWRWSSSRAARHDGLVQSVLAVALDGPGGDARAALLDLVALNEDDEPDALAAPSWLERVHERLCDDGEPLDIAAAARDAGVHRVHLTRAFARRFGAPPSVYRARRRLARGVRNLVGGDSPAAAAASAGYADQSHFTRAARSGLGLTPGRLRSLLLAA